MGYSERFAVMWWVVLYGRGKVALSVILWLIGVCDIICGTVCYIVVIVTEVVYSGSCPVLGSLGLFVVL